VQTTHNAFKIELDSLPPEEQAESLIEDMEQLVTYKNLKAGQGKSLIKKLE
jgi:hypothetical protein